MTKELQTINPPRCVPFGHTINIQTLETTPFYLPIEENSGLNIIIRGENPSPFILKVINSLNAISPETKINIKRNCVASMVDLINNPKDTHNIFFISESVSDEIRNNLKSLIVIDTFHSLTWSDNKTVIGDVANIYILNMSFMPSDRFVVSLANFKD